MQQLNSNTASTNSAINKVGEDVRSLKSEVHILSASHNALLARVATLESELASCKNNSSEVKELSRQVQGWEQRFNSYTSSNYTREIVIDGATSSASDSPMDLVGKVFDALGIPDLRSEVLNIRNLGKNPSPVVGQAAATLNADRSRRVRLLVALKSRAAREVIMGQKRELRDRLAEDIFGIDIPDKVYVNEHLPPEVYKLLRFVKTEARKREYKYVWTKAGRIWSKS